MSVVLGRSLLCIVIARKKCRVSEDSKLCEVIEYYRCFR